jgi:CheY-like chemotaxis protein
MTEARSPRVLLIEDDFVQAGLLRRWLESEGLNVRHANTGDAAWKLMTDGSHWDLVISDLNLPDRSPRRRGVPFLLLTAYQEFDSAVQALR